MSKSTQVGRGIAATLAAALLMLLGCAGDGGGTLAVHSVSKHGTTLTGGFNTALYRFDDRNNLTLVLLEGKEDNPTQAATIRVFWEPRGGRTPIDPDATNATIHYVIFSGGPKNQVGIYSGAGFVRLKGDPGSQTINAGVWQSTLRLTDKSDGFGDLLGQAQLKGSINAIRDDTAVEELLRRIDVTVRERLGYPRLVDASSAK